MERPDHKKMKPTNMIAAAVAVMICATLVTAACAPAEAPQQQDTAQPPTAAQPTTDPLPSDPAKAVTQARATYDRSVALGFAWRPAKQALEQAEAALAEGDGTAALDAAVRAIRLADASIAQAEHEAQAWQHRPPFNP